MVFLAMNSVDISEEAKVLMVITTNFVERLYEDAIEERRHQATGRMKRKAIGTTDTTQTRNQACCSRRNDKIKEIDVSLARRRKLLREEGPGSTVKISSIMI